MSTPQDPHHPAPREPGQEPPAQPPVRQVGVPAQPGSPPPPQAPPPGIPQFAVPGPYAAQQPGTPPYGAPDQFGTPAQPPKRSRKSLWIVLGIVGGVLLLVAIGVGVLLSVVGGATNKARGLADDFNKLIIAGDTGTAYEMYLDPALMDKLSKEDFTAGVQGLELDGSCKPKYTDLSVSSDNGINGADVAGALDCDGKKVELAYRFEGNDELKMVNIRLRPAA